ncbi:RDD family protein [Sulfurovum sp. XGS-02]|uniref:RDD family protein n=1 Tax=Sulfurovum sp. XGS-02 TaxID=2925411 RepID=UPI00206C3FF1|nr:RDD family protein [Sulfurovum sp. XGS-02]UPT77573.1 RDD family protein [Sulfurovum sp. XGS-02]
MAKQRFREIKQGKVQAEIPKPKALSNQNDYASSGVKVKAFLTDAFMLLMPIMYIVFYLVMDGREDFAEHKMLGWIYILLPLVILQTLFMYKTGQTPGYRAYNITLIDEHTKKRPSLFIILFRNLAAILSLFTFLGWIVMFFRKDNKTLHDLLSATAVVNKK